MTNRAMNVVTDTEYDAAGRKSADIDALGSRTAYAYDQYGNLAAVTNPLGNAVVYDYDLRGRKTYEGGATYPVRYTYDVFGNKTTMMTYRDESLGPASGDITTWLYDEASNCMTNKVYADGLGPKYKYDLKGNLTKRTWARGVETFYAYDEWGNLTNTSYSDNTPTVALSYDASGRQTEALDAAGVTTFAYDDFESLTNETVIGVAGTNVIERFCDTFGRSLGYALNGERRTTLSYEPDKGRIASMLAAGATNEFRWTYLPGSDLKESLVYPNGDVVRWEYEPKRDLLTFVSNATHSAYRYTYDAAGRCVSKNDELYGYNVRNELILATNVITGVEFAYCYDDIGNRLWSREFGTNTTYAVNNLNQYTEIVRGGVVEHPAFDADGSQTDITTGTGRWLVEYNGENRPIRWNRVASSSTTTNSVTPTLVSMSYDRMGRRVRSGADIFVYDGYLNIGNTIWDPTEPVATRPFVRLEGASPSYYFHDGSKNVSDMFGDAIWHYNYSPFGMTTTDSFVYDDVWGFSSEMVDGSLSLVYYNYRHFDSLHGRWMSRDSLSECSSINLYCFVENNISQFDHLGQVTIPGTEGLAIVLLVDAYLKMRKANTKGADKWFHCMGMCRAASFNSSVATLSAFAREFSDIIAWYYKNIAGNTNDSNDTIIKQLLDSLSDMEANATGISCPASEDCKCCCEKYLNGAPSINPDDWF